MKKIYNIIIVFVFLLPGSIFSQETITGVHFNAAIKKYRNQHLQNILKHGKSISDTLTLPFFDDFATPSIFPNAALWVDSNAFVNTGFNPYMGNSLTDVEKSHNPPSIGVATLDALDKNGDIYSKLLPNVTGSADTLTSKHINLNFLPGDSAFLSFEYQPTGVGNAPEADDSLVLEFYSPIDTAEPWHHIWSAFGSTDKTFRKVMIAIKDTIFLQNGFRFRFINYVSLGSNYEPSWLSNCDQWNLDYIYLDTNRHINNDVYNDVSFLYPMKSVLKNSLESMPWLHFKSYGTNMIDTTIYFISRNLGSIGGLPIYNLKIRDMSGTIPVYKNGFYENVLAYSINFHRQNFSPLYPITLPVGNSAAFEFTCYLNWFNDTIPLNVDSIIPKRIRYNDTIRYYQNFDNYYAYDDGTAENGYGLSGEGTQNARMALKYKCYKRDTLQGAYMFFNNTHDDYTGNKYFYLKAWSDAGGMPDAELTSQIGEHPFFDGLNEFHFHAFESPVVIDSGATFYIGVQQTTTDMLNIGLDRNRDAHENCYYNISGSWVQSSYVGALMIRPAFGMAVANLSAENKMVKKTIEIYPNPASDKINIILPENYSSEKAVICINDICGKTIKQQHFANIINISALSPGIYFVSVTDYNKYNFTKKIIITH